MKYIRDLFPTFFLVLAFSAVANGQWGNNNNNNNGWQNNNNGWQNNNGWGAAPETSAPTLFSTTNIPTASPTGSPTPSPTPSPTLRPTNAPVEAIILDQVALLATTTVPLGGQLDGTELEYIVNRADARAEGRDTVTMTYTIPKESWIAIGFTNGNGQMVGAEAVIGLPDSGEVLKYSMSSKLLQGVVPMPEDQQTLIETSLVQNGGTTRMTFTKILDEAEEIPISIGNNTFIAAYGFDNELFIHERRDSFAVDLVAGEVEVVETRKKALWKAHGLCAALAWGYASPMAIGVAILRYWLPNGLWFKLHQALNMSVAVLTVLAFGFAVAAINAEGLSHFSASPSPHRLVGLVVFLLLVAQTLGGIFRPHAAEKGETKTSTRSAWEIGHRVLGISLLLMAWYQIASGIKIYQTLFVESAGTNLLGILWGSIGAIVAIVVVGRIFAYREEAQALKKNQDDDVTMP